MLVGLILKIVFVWPVQTSFWGWPPKVSQRQQLNKRIIHFYCKNAGTVHCSVIQGVESKIFRPVMVTMGHGKMEGRLSLKDILMGHSPLKA
jgi:hypothetical protein